MEAHGEDLRVECDCDDIVARVKRDWKQAELEGADRALCELAEKLTARPSAVDDADLNELRRHGFSDAAIHDAAQVIAYFNYINRVAEALGTDLEPEMVPRPTRKEG